MADNQSTPQPNINLHGSQNTYNSHQQNKTESNENLISLLNFDPHGKEPHFLTRYYQTYNVSRNDIDISPRSIEALRNLCFEEVELLMKKKEDFINEALPEEFANERNYYAEIKLDHYETRRQEKVKMCLEVMNNDFCQLMTEKFSGKGENYSED